MSFKESFLKLFKKKNKDEINKEDAEFEYWEGRYNSENNNLANEHYKYFYTTAFDLDEEFYNDKKILDIGCGPRGSLEWADMASERIGLDPLVDKYRNFGIEKHEMEYVCAGSEKIPFEDNYFDIVCSFNSLDHVNDLEKTINEIKRVLNDEGTFLLLSELNHDPTPCEPISFSFDIVDRFKPLKIQEKKSLEKTKNGIYESIEENVLYDYSNKEKRYGIILASFKKED